MSSITVIAISAVISAFATILIAWFNWQLVGVTDEMKKVTSEAAEAARQSAEAAKLALNAERPYSFALSPKLTHTPERRASFASVAYPTGTGEPTGRISIGLAFDIINRGKGIAIFSRIDTRLYVAPSILGRAANERSRLDRPRGRYVDDRLRFYMLASQEIEEYKVPQSFVIEPDEWVRIKARNSVLIVVVKVHYSDVFKSDYTASVRCEYYPPSEGISGADILPGMRPLTLPPFDGFLAIDHRHSRYT